MNYKKILIGLLVLLLIPLLLANTKSTQTNIAYLNVATPANTEVIHRFDRLFTLRSGASIEVTISKVGIQYSLLFDFGNNTRQQLLLNELPHYQLEGFSDMIGRMPRHATWSNTAEGHILWYDFQQDPSDAPIIAELPNVSNIYGFRPFVYLNTSTNEVTGTRRLIIHGVTSIRNDHVFVDFVFPKQLDDLIQISVDYEWRSNQGFISWTSWRQATVTRINGKSSINTSLSNIVNSWYTFQWARTKRMLMGGASSEHITDVSNRYRGDANARSTYLNNINNRRRELGLTNLTSAELFGTNNQNSVFQVYLDYHQLFAQTALEVRNVSIVEILYQYRGELFHVGGDDIEDIITGDRVGMDGQDLRKWFNSFFNFNNSTFRTILFIVLIVVGIIFLPLIFKVIVGLKYFFLILVLPFKIIFIPLITLSKRKKKRKKQEQMYERYINQQHHDDRNNYLK